MNTLLIRDAATADEARWRTLFTQYIAFYRASVTESAIARTWSRILDPNSNIHALVAEQDGRIIGICNYLMHDSTWSAAQTCYLQDLFVDKDARGSGAAKALIKACEAKAKAAGCFRLYWLTQEFNAPARSLYDTLAQRTSFIVYRVGLEG